MAKPPTGSCVALRRKVIQQKPEFDEHARLPRCNCMFARSALWSSTAANTAANVTDG